MSDTYTGGIERDRCAMGDCLEEPTNRVELRRGDHVWQDDYCDEHAEHQLEFEDAEIVHSVEPDTDRTAGDESDD